MLVLEHLPQTTPHSDWMDGKLLESGMMQQLETQRFTGFASFAFEKNWLGGILFYQGKALEAWRRALGGLENRAEAYRNLLPMLEFAKVRFFALPTEIIPGIVALTLSERLETYDATKVNIAQMLLKLEENNFGGAMILESNQTAQAWFFTQGKQKLSIPEVFNQGRLHLLHNPSSIPEDVVRFSSAETNQEQAARTDWLHSKLEALLIEHIGVNAKPILELNQRLFAVPDPQRLQETIEIWLEETYGIAMKERFNQQLET